MAPAVLVLHCESQPCEVLSSLLLAYFLPSLASPNLLSTVLPSTLNFSSCEPLRRKESVWPVDTSFCSKLCSQLDVPSQACWDNERWRDINLIAVRDRYIDRVGCNKPRHDCRLPVRLAFSVKASWSMYINGQEVVRGFLCCFKFFMFSPNHQDIYLKLLGIFFFFL